MGIETMVIGIYLAVINIVAFVAFGLDKRRAKREEWRIPERTLLVLAFLGGGLGAVLGMLAFRHKTRKLRFRILVPIALVLSLLVGGGALYFSDYYHADGTAVAATTSTESVEVHAIGGGCLAFIPKDPVAGMVVYPGAKVEATAYAPLMRLCAEQGVLCVLVQPPLNFALLSINAVQGAMAQFPQVDTWIVAGHSLGGVAASQYASENPDAVDALVFLASYPAADLSGFAGSTLSIVGTEDGVLNREAYADGWSLLPQGATELVITGGNHAYFGDYGEQGGDGTATISREDQQTQTADAIIALADQTTRTEVSV